MVGQLVNYCTDLNSMSYLFRESQGSLLLNDYLDLRFSKTVGRFQHRAFRL